MTSLPRFLTQHLMTSLSHFLNQHLMPSDSISVVPSLQIVGLLEQNIRDMTVVQLILNSKGSDRCTLPPFSLPNWWNTSGY